MCLCQVSLRASDDLLWGEAWTSEMLNRSDYRTGSLAFEWLPQLSGVAYRSGYRDVILYCSDLLGE